MSIKQRLEQASTAAELHEVMHEVWNYGSRNWTRDAAIRFVHPPLWDVLDRYFDASGHLSAEFPEIARGEFDEVVAAGAGSEERGASAALPVSVLELIAGFHLELEALRAAPARWTPPTEPPSSTGPIVAVYAEATAAERNVPLIQEPQPAAPVVVQAAPEDSRFLCPICLARSDEDATVFRGKSMCPSCVRLLRGH